MPWRTSSSHSNDGWETIPGEPSRMKIAVVLGTRPEIVKMAPVIKALERREANYFILHTGQHYSYNLDAVFFKQLKLPTSKYNLEVGSASHAEQTARIMVRAEKVLQKEEPGVALVQGDTNSVLAVALTAVKAGVKVGHIEAGLRSYDRTMPEEINRVLTDHGSDWLFAPTEKSRQILLGEGIPEKKIFVTGNTIVDAVCQNLELIGQETNVLPSLDLSPREFILVTLHRQENVDNHEKFASILRGLERVMKETNLPMVYPVHPHSRRRFQEFGLKTDTLRFTDPVDYFTFLQLVKNARLVLTDSGGVQEESCVLGIPCVTLRDNTERPETLEAGANILAGTKPDKIAECVRLMLNRKGGWQNPFGDGKAAERIVDIILEAGDG